MIDIEMIKRELAGVLKEHSELLENKRNIIKREKELRRKIFELRKILINCEEEEEEDE